MFKMLFTCADILGLLFTVLYLFASVAVQIWGGTELGARRTPDDLNGTLVF